MADGRQNGDGSASGDRTASENGRGQIPPEYKHPDSFYMFPKCRFPGYRFLKYRFSNTGSKDENFKSGLIARDMSPFAFFAIFAALSQLCYHIHLLRGCILAQFFILEAFPQELGPAPTARSPHRLHRLHWLHWFYRLHWALTASSRAVAGRLRFGYRF